MIEPKPRRGKRRVRYNQVMAAVASGLKTAREISESLGIPRNNVSVCLYDLAGENSVVRLARRHTGAPGRAPLEWKLPELRDVLS